MCGGILSACTLHACNAHRGQQMASDLQELELIDSCETPTG